MDTTLLSGAADAALSTDTAADAGAAGQADQQGAAAADAGKTGDQAAGDQQAGAEGDAGKKDGADGKTEGEKEDDGKPEGAPETYEAFTMPEGVELDQAAVDAFTPVAKELNLTQTQAQKLVDLQAGFQAKAMTALVDSWTSRNETWVGEVKADAEFGGAKLNDTLAASAKAIKAFGDGENGAELREALKGGVSGNHPALVRFFARVGRAIGDDSLVRSGSSSAGAPRSDADFFYGSSN